MHGGVDRKQSCLAVNVWHGQILQIAFPQKLYAADKLFSKLIEED